MTAVGAALACVPPAAATPARSGIAHEEQPTAIAAFNGRLVWSRAVATACDPEPTCRRYGLITRYEGRTSRLRVRTRQVPFDIDLGPGPDGQTVAVYSRCREEPLLVGENDLPLYASGGGCDLFLYDFRRRSERRLNIARPRVSEVLPAIWRRQVAFVARDDRTRSRGNPAVSRILLGRLDDGPLRVVHRANDVAQPRSPSRASGRGPIGLDLRGSTVATSWQVDVDRCSTESAGGYASLMRSVLRLDLGALSRVVEAACTAGGETYFADPVLRRGELYYYWERPGQDSPNQLRHYVLRDRRTRGATLEPTGRPIAATVDPIRGDFFTSERTLFTDPAEAARRRDTDLYELRDLSFQPVPRLRG